MTAEGRGSGERGDWIQAERVCPGSVQAGTRNLGMSVGVSLLRGTALFEGWGSLELQWPEVSGC